MKQTVLLTLTETEMMVRELVVDRQGRWRRRWPGRFNLRTRMTAKT